MKGLARVRAAEVAIERGDGLMAGALLAAGLTVVVISPNQVKNLRSRYGSAGNKDDRFDAFVLAGTTAPCDARGAGDGEERQNGRRRPGPPGHRRQPEIDHRPDAQRRHAHPEGGRLRGQHRRGDGGVQERAHAHDHHGDPPYQPASPPSAAWSHSGSCRRRLRPRPPLAGRVRSPVPSAAALSAAHQALVAESAAVPGRGIRELPAKCCPVRCGFRL